VTILLRPVLAHESWFVPDQDRFPLQWERLDDLPVLVAVVTALAAVAVFTMVDRLVNEPRLVRLDGLVRLERYLPRIVSVAIGLALAGTAAQGAYLAPNMDLPDGPVGIALAALELVAAALLVLGVRRRATAALLVAAGPAGMLVYGVQPVLERADVLGAAAFLALAGGRKATPELRACRNPQAALVMRLLAGLAIAVLAFTEKLLNPELALDFLHLHPAFDLFSVLGVSADFVWFAASMELTLAALLASGQLPRLTALVVATPFVATLPLLGYVELLGHLPLYAVVLVVAVEAQAQRVREAETEAAESRPHREVPPALRGLVRPASYRRPETAAR
jgi:hypothetical protein